MTKYYYIKIKRKNIRKHLRLTGVIMLLFGVFLLFYFFFPVVSYQLFLKNSQATSFEAPLPRYLIAREKGLSSLLSERLASLTQDFTDARNWFPGSVSASTNSLLDSYLISIPKLGIEGAQVSTKNFDLLRNLVHYSGTSNPGDPGTSVIFGHSTLPQLFNPKNYKTIFATLHKLKVRDEVLINVEGITYKYKIFSITVTDPTDPNIFSQSYDDSYITLVTCTPPGTVWKRLIVQASLVN